MDAPSLIDPGREAQAANREHFRESKWVNLFS